MNRRQLWLLGFSTLIGAGHGATIMAILPVYLTKLGADTAFTGVYFAFLWLALAISAVFAGWLADRFHHWKRLALLSAAVMVISQAGQVFTSALIPFCALSLLIAFAVSIYMTMVSVLAGLQAGENERGRVFGILSTAGSLGGILTGLVYGKIADQIGFAGLWWFVCALFALTLLAALFYREPHLTTPEPPVECEHCGPPEPAPSTRGGFRGGGRLGGRFYLLLAASVICWVMINGGRLGISVSMDRYQFSAADISLNGAIAGIVALPSGLAMGWLSDRVGRKRLMIVLNLLGMISLLILGANHSRLAFWTAAVLFSFNATFATLSQALTTDLVPRRSLGMGLSLISTSISAGGVIGSAALGYAFQGIGMTATFFIALAFPVVVMGLMMFMPETKRGRLAELPASS